MAYFKPLIPKPRKPRAKETKPRKPRLLKHERQAAFLHNFDAIISLVRAGATFAQAVAQTPGAPCLATFKKMAAASPDHATRMGAALRARESGMNHRYGRVNRLDDAALDAILAAIEDQPTRHVNEICKELGHGYNSIVSRARRDRAFRIKLDQVLQRRADVRGDDGPNLHLAALSRNDLFRNAAALLHVADGQDADDLLQDAILAMLESRDVNRDELMRAHYRKVSASSFGAKSLDEEMFSDDSGRVLTRSDFIPASTEIADIHAW